MSTQAVNPTMPPTSHDQERKAVPMKARRFLDWFSKVMPTVLVVVTIGGLAYWGHRTEWNFIERQEPDKVGASDKNGLAMIKSEPGTPTGSGTPPGVRVVFPSIEAVEKAGIDIAPVWQTAMTEEVMASGEVLFDPSLVARLSPRASGTAWWVPKTAGDTVKAGEILALIDATEVGRAKAEYQQALVRMRLKRQGFINLQAAPGVISERQRREAEAALKDAEVRLFGAEQALTNLGLPVRSADFENLSLDEIVRRMRLTGVSESVSGLEVKGITSNLIPVRAPFGGIVLSADVIAGEMVEAGKVLFVVVDPKRLWLTLHVSHNSVQRVVLGQTVKFSPDGSLDGFEGRVTWIGTAAAENTRTVPVRAELTNEVGKLRSSTLGKGRIVLRTEENAMVVPHEAVQMFRGTPIVFVRHPDYLKTNGPKSFEARAVRLGGKDNQSTEILVGLLPGDVVATKGSGFLLNELQHGVGR